MSGDASVAEVAEGQTVTIQRNSEGEDKSLPVAKTFHRETSGSDYHIYGPGIYR